MEAKIDLIYPESGKIYGNVAQRLFSNKMDVNSLRSNATLPLEVWKEFDKAVLKVARNRMPCIGDLIQRGLTYPLKNALGKTVLGYQKLSDIADASLDMDARSGGIEDRATFTWGYLPLPICHADFSITARDLAASQDGGQPLDTTMIELATRKVAERLEYIYINGASSFTHGGGTIYGLHDFTPAATGSLNPHWDHSAGVANGATILDDVSRMKAAAAAKKHFGPFVLYVPTAFDAKLDNPYNAYTGTTIRQQLKQIDKIEDVKAADYLPADHVALVEMDASTVRIIEGMQPTVVQWDSQGGMDFHFKVMAIMVPQLRADIDSNTGIVVYS